MRIQGASTAKRHSLGQLYMGMTTLLSCCLTKNTSTQKTRTATAAQPSGGSPPMGVRQPCSD